MQTVTNQSSQDRSDLLDMFCGRNHWKKPCTDGESGRTKSMWSSTTNISWTVGKSNWFSALHIISWQEHRRHRHCDCRILARQLAHWFSDCCITVHIYHKLFETNIFYIDCIVCCQRNYLPTTTRRTILIKLIFMKFRHENWQLLVKSKVLTFRIGYTCLKLLVGWQYTKLLQ